MEADLPILLLATVLAVGSAGGSAVLTRRPPPDCRALGEFECTGSWFVPVVHGLLAARGLGIVGSARYTGSE